MIELARSRGFFPEVLMAALARAGICAVGCRSARETPRPAVSAAGNAAPRNDSVEPFDADDIDTLPVLVEHVPVQVPDPRRGGTSGQVTVRAVIDERGTVDEAEVTSARPGCASSATT